MGEDDNADQWIGYSNGILNRSRHGLLGVQSIRGSV